MTERGATEVASVDMAGEATNGFYDLQALAAGAQALLDLGKEDWAHRLMRMTGDRACHLARRIDALSLDQRHSMPK